MKKVTATALVVLVLIVPLLAGQTAARSTGKGQRQHSVSGQTNSGKAAAGGEAAQPKTGVGQSAQEEERLRLRGREQDRFEGCAESADCARVQAGELRQLARGKDFNRTEAQRQQDRLREHIQSMEKEHERFLAGLNEQQRTAAQLEIRELEQLRQEIATQLDSIDQALRASQPQAKRIALEVRELEKSLIHWQLVHRTLGREFGITPAPPVVR